MTNLIGNICLAMMGLFVILPFMLCVVLAFMGINFISGIIATLLVITFIYGTITIIKCGWDEFKMEKGLV